MYIQLIYHKSILNKISSNFKKNDIIIGTQYLEM
jgi:hypothetical protein